MDQQVKEGDVVSLKCGGEKMVVVRIFDSSALCYWQLLGEHREHIYELCALKVRNS